MDRSRYDQGTVDAAQRIVAVLAADAATDTEAVTGDAETIAVAKLVRSGIDHGEAAALLLERPHTVGVSVDDTCLWVVLTYADEPPTMVTSIELETLKSSAG